MDSKKKYLTAVWKCSELMQALCAFALGNEFRELWLRKSHSLINDILVIINDISCE